MDVHGDSPPNSWVENDQRHCQHQYEETQTEKTGEGKINGIKVQREETPSAPLLVDSLHSSSNSPHPLEANLKLKPPGKLSTTHTKGSSNFKSRMNCKNDKLSELKTAKSKRESLALSNGIVLLNSGQFTNGYPSEPSPDIGCSSPESRYITPKKRWVQRNAKAMESLNFGQDRAVPPAATPMVPSKHETDRHISEPAEKPTGSQLNCSGELAKAEALTIGSEVRESSTFITDVTPVDEPQCKNTDGMASADSVKKPEDRPGKTKQTSAVATREDSWTLFKPPPVFPVDNSSAKTVPRISYASKVKENLNKAAVEMPPPQTQVSTRLSQVPMSAVKTINSPSFTNDPLSGEGYNCPLPAPLFTTAAAYTASSPVSPSRKAENEASSSSNGTTNAFGTTSATAGEQKSSFFLYPLVPSSNMQPHHMFPSVCRQVDSPAAMTNSKSLVDIFQNQWGLSFINEPSSGAGVGVAVGQPAGNGPVVEVTFQGGIPAALENCPVPKTYEQDKRTSLRTPGRCLPPASGAQKGEAECRAAIVFSSSSSSKDPGAELPRSSWGSFDLKAAVIYHTKEVEYILNLQKQDPKQVVLYGETKDGPFQ